MKTKLEELKLKLPLGYQFENSQNRWFLSDDKNNNYIGNPISEAITIKSEEIKETINLEFNKPIYIKSNYFYLVISNSIEKTNPANEIAIPQQGVIDSFDPTGLTISEVKEFAKTNFYGGSNAEFENSDREDYLEVRKRAAREAAMSGYSLSLISRDFLGKADGTIQKLEGTITSSADLRGDVAANTAILLEVYKQLSVQQALLASQVEMASIDIINEDQEFQISGGGYESSEVKDDSAFNASNLRIKAPISDEEYARKVAIERGESYSSGGGLTVGDIGNVIRDATSGSGSLVLQDAVKGRYGTTSNFPGRSQTTSVSGWASDLLKIAEDVARATGNHEVAGMLGKARSSASNVN